MADVVTEKVINKLAHGYSIEQVATQIGETADVVFQIWQQYARDRKVMPQEEQWLLHLVRLELLLQKAHDVIEENMDAKSIEAAVKLMERIEELQDLNLARRRDAEKDVVELTEMQVGLLFKITNAIASGFRAQLEQAGSMEVIKGEILGDFDNKFLALQRAALEEASNGAE